MSETNNIKWVWCVVNGATPEVKGCYAILYSYDPREGIFDAWADWDGEKWSTTEPIGAFSSTPFSSEFQARDWAEANNPDNLQEKI